MTATDGTAEEWKHRAKCLEAEVSARSAATVRLRLENDILEEGLMQAKREIARLKGIMRVRCDGETAPAESGKEETR